MVKPAEQSQGQQLLKQLKDAYRRPSPPEHSTECDPPHASGGLPDPRYWPAEISRAIN